MEDILAVDDDRANLKILASILVQAGYRVRPASDGPLALRSIQARRPALILLDMRMPGMDGPELCRRLKAESATRDIPVIVLSSLAEAADKAKVLELGAVDYITKPFEPQEVLARIRVHLDLSAAREQLHVRNTELDRINRQLQHEIDERSRVEEALAATLVRLRALTERLTRTREEERSRIAFELHEKSGQELTTLRMHLQMLRAHCHGQAAQGSLADAMRIADVALERVRGMSLDLHPLHLDDLGLYAALHALGRRQAEAAGWQLHMELPEQAPRPSRELEVACYRVVQEALTNVAQHAGATSVKLTLHRDAESLELRVSDNGAGFDSADIQRYVECGRLGLFAMEERLRQLGGRLQIDSQPGQGTEIRGVFPHQDS